MAIDFAKWRLPPILEICFVQPSAARPDHESPQPSHLIRFAIGIVTAELLEMVVVAGQHQRGSTLVKPAVGGFHLLEFSPVAGFGTFVRPTQRGIGLFAGFSAVAMAVLP